MVLTLRMQASQQGWFFPSHYAKKENRLQELTYLDAAHQQTKNAGNGVQRDFFELVCTTKREKGWAGNM